jgi:hypothetical protein
MSRRSNRRSDGGLVRIVEIVSEPLAKIVRRPIDFAAVLAAAAASLVVVVNAIFLQSGPHPAPFFTNPTTPQDAGIPLVAPVPAGPRVAETPRPRSPVSQMSAQAAAAKRGDPIADLIGASVGSPARVAAVQRVLAEFGYGQIKPTGTLDGATSAAIEKFEGEHKMPVTGRLSDRLLAELAGMTGRPLE